MSPKYVCLYVFWRFKMNFYMDRDYLCIPKISNLSELIK